MLKNINDLFFEQLRISIGTQQNFSCFPTDEEWIALFGLSVKQSLSGVMMCGFEITLENDVPKKPSVLFEWIGVQQNTIAQNALQNRRAKELYEIFKKGGYRTCVLKGQGTATYYEKPELRQCGDIDMWVEGDRDEIVKFVQSKNIHIESVDVKDSTMYFFDDVMVEVHFRPNCMFSPIKDRKLQSFFKEMAPTQFSAFDEKLGCAHTTIEFDLVYSLVHIYRHIFSEGIGLRQLVDYYYILKHSNAKQRATAFKTVCGLGMESFTGGIMYILQRKLGMDKTLALCEENVKHGVFLLNEILIGGNFGHYDNRYQLAAKDKKFKRGVTMLKRNMHSVMLYPSEVLWSPIWKLWHWCWRNQKGYL